MMRNAEALFDAALDCLSAGDWDGAIAHLRDTLALEPRHRDATHGLIRALDHAGRGEEAAAAALALIANAPDDVLARTSLSMIYQRMGRIPEAEKAALDAKLLGWKMELRGTRWFVATTNAGKLRDFAGASGDRIRLEPLPGLAALAEPAEDEDTFEGNARIKAVYYSGFAPGEMVVADDSGLEVDALGGRPGVRSARFADDLGFRGPSGASRDARNNLCLMGLMLSQRTRDARYRCVLVAARDGVVVSTASGSVEGSIAETPRGDGGFGYDPLFLVRDRTMAERDAAERLALNHRGKALAALIAAMEGPAF